VPYDSPFAEGIKFYPNTKTVPSASRGVSLTVRPDLALEAADLAVQLEQIAFQVSLAGLNKQM
jgi:hypothetical protein